MFMRRVDQNTRQDQLAFRSTGRNRPGIAFVYTTIAFVALVGMVSLAVDLGRAQCAKTELQRAADAAARYGATGISDSTAVTKAAAAAAENLVDGTPLVLNNDLAGSPKDIEVGNWDSTLTPKFSTSRTPSNAVRVTARRTAARQTAIPLLFAKLLGQNTCDLTCTSIAAQNIPIPNFIGLNGITAKNNVGVGYDPVLGVPSATNLTSGASIASNASITFNNNPSINGSVLLGPSGTFSGSSPAPIRLSEDLSYPATENPPFAATGSLTVNGTVHITGGGTKVYTSINLSNNSTLIFDSPTTVYVMTNINFAQSGEIKPSTNLPVDLKIRVIGGPTSVIGGTNANNVTITGQVYAPNSDFIAHNNGELRGTGLYRTMFATNALNLYYDITQKSVVYGLNNSGGSGVVLVQ
jgi:Flp pilus assembly protein TadG